MKQRQIALGILAGLIFLSGCKLKKEGKPEVDKLEIIQGNNQCVLPDSKCKKEFRIELLSPQYPGIFGGKGSRYPVPNVKVNLVSQDGSQLKFDPETPVSDNGGMIRFNVISGRVVGDQYFKVIPEGFPDASKTCRIINGVNIEGQKQEAYVGNLLSKPVEITVVNADNKPVKGAKVYFRVAYSPEKKKFKAKCKPSSAVTDENGMVKTEFKIGNTTGKYKILAEIVAPQANINIRGIEITELGLNLKGLIVTVLGGLAIFIFGMKLMSEGLQLVAGEKMKSVLSFFTSNRVKAILAGTLVTGVIQSSSACTVMVVGFVNAGLLTLTQAIGIVFGANIGTTVTAQMISFKLGGLALPSVIIGLIILMFSKKTFAKGWAQSLIGFGLLFYGLGLMGNELKLISKFPSFIAFFQQFDCYPVDGHMPFLSVLGAIAIGTFMTVIIQSSSATIGIALALAAGGLINFYTAVPLILGDNIGTTITALLASIGANERARQTALAHMLFNVLGTCYMVILFYIPYHGVPVFLYLINYITPGDVFSVVPENIGRHIAMAHTLFNVFNVLLFVGFINVIAKLCNMIIKVQDEKSIKLQYLEPNLLNTPSIALEQTIKAIRYMGKESWAMIQKAMNEAFLKYETDESLERELESREDKIDELQKDVTDYMVQLTGKVLTEPQSEIIPLLMHCTNDAERIADFTENILLLTRRIKESKNKLSDTARKELDIMWKVLSDQAENVIACLDNTDKENINVALRDETKINKLADEFEENHVKRLREGECDPIVGIIFIELINDLERVADHFTNIAERAPDIQKHHLELSN